MMLTTQGCIELDFCKCANLQIWSADKIPAQFRLADRQGIESSGPGPFGSKGLLEELKVLEGDKPPEPEEMGPMEKEEEQMDEGMKDGSPGSMLLFERQGAPPGPPPEVPMVGVIHKLFKQKIKPNYLKGPTTWRNEFVFSLDSEGNPPSSVHVPTVGITNFDYAIEEVPPDRKVTLPTSSIDGKLISKTAEDVFEILTQLEVLVMDSVHN